MEQQQEQLKRGLTRAVLRHGWIPRLCAVAGRLSQDDYLRPHLASSFHVSDPEITNVSELTRRISESQSQQFTTARESDSQALVHRLPWDVLKNTAIPSVADFLRRTQPINLPIPSTSAPNVPGAGTANRAARNVGDLSHGVNGRDAALINPTTRRHSDTGSGLTSSSATQTAAAVADAENQVQLAHAATQHEESAKQDFGTQTVLDVSTIGTQYEHSTCDASTETQLLTSSTATQCVVEVTDSAVQVQKEYDTKGTQHALDTAEIGTQTDISKTFTTEIKTETCSEASSQREWNCSEECEAGCCLTDPRDTSPDLFQLIDHINVMVQKYSDNINSEVSDFIQKENTKKRLIGFLKSLQRPDSKDSTTLLPPSTEFSTAIQEISKSQTLRNGTYISSEMSNGSVTSVRRCSDDSFSNTVEANNVTSKSSDEGPPSAIVLPEVANDTLTDNTNAGGNIWMAVGPEEGRSEAQSPLYRLPPPVRSQNRYQTHLTEAETGNHDMEKDGPAASAIPDSTLSMYDDGTGIKVPNASVPIIQEANISWRLKPDGTCHILGSGSFGTVAAATLRKPDGTVMDVAVKKNKFERNKQSFVREGKMTSFLSDTGVFPEFYGFLKLGPQNNPAICLVSELYGNGITLADVLEQNNLGSLKSWMSIAVQLAEGLLKIHQKNVIFNDIKPNNILVNISRPREPVVKFIDLGMSSYKHGITYNFTIAQLQAVPHLAPEVKLKQPTSVLSDIWGLGVTYWDMAYVSRLPGLKEVSNAALKDNPEERISLEGIVDTLVAIGRCHGC